MDAFKLCLGRAVIAFRRCSMTELEKVELTREYQRRYYAKHKKQIKKYYVKHREQRLEYQHRYYAEHKEQVKEYQRRYRAL